MAGPHLQRRTRNYYLVMKAILLLLLLTLSASAQLVTNIAVRVTADVVNIGVSTNSTQTTLNLKADIAKDRVLIDGVAWDYFSARSNGQTNSFDFYLARVKIKDDFKITADAKNRAESAATLEKLTRLLTTEIDLLTAGDLSSLSTIAAKAP